MLATVLDHPFFFRYLIQSFIRLCFPKIYEIISDILSVTKKYNAPGRDRTCDLELRRFSLYPTELQEPVNLGFWIADCGLSSFTVFE